ncbi:hypoxanthine phosphoribosyltransferase [Bombilactobacillus thymidiniphilus]|uniref:Hypoxanthine phosphoribosyltransferase n=1 Tax=Bombilactobacillus thymidiniphilus TaxID=2923363 RepID=A0ABY4PEV4_9LACO|nr:hypoxanthine phosphoribosyltransferase [Bombilactobacillus thymidiniphilus]UQS84334.1 hypoxanthine phosphoribosyltransferase [Bombilactobacillus thymidiniphilus]
MNQDMQKVLFSEEEIAQANQKLGKLLANDYKGKNPLFVCILKGAVVFLTDLVRQIPDSVDLEFIDASSYNGQTTTSGEVKILKDLDVSVAGRDVVFVEDIIDTGLTLKALMDLFKERHANSIKIVALLDKPANRQQNVKVDYVGLQCPDEFVVGYGMDYNERYRNLSYIGVLKPEVYMNN